jgi:hypothetical protein
MFYNSIEYIEVAWSSRHMHERVTKKKENKGNAGSKKFHDTGPRLIIRWGEGG